MKIFKNDVDTLIKMSEEYIEDELLSATSSLIGYITVSYGIVGIEKSLGVNISGMKDYDSCMDLVYDDIISYYEGNCSQYRHTGYVSINGEIICKKEIKLKKTN